MCFVLIWEQTATCATYSINWLVFITKIKSVYCTVWTGSLNKSSLRFVFKWLNVIVTWNVNLLLSNVAYCVTESEVAVPLCWFHLEFSQNSLLECITFGTWYQSSSKNFQYQNLWPEFKYVSYPVLMALRNIGENLFFFLLWDKIVGWIVTLTL